MIRSRTSSRKGQKSGESPGMAYAQGVLNGDIVAGRLVRLACERHIREKAVADKGEGLFYFSDEAAQHAFDFFRFLRHSKGEWAGREFELSPWEQFIIAALFGWRKRSDHTRRFRTALIETARKQGKSTLAAAIGLYLFYGDGEPGAEVYTSGTKKDQAKIVHSEAVRMIAASPELRRAIGTFKDRLFVEGTASKFEPLGADSDTLDGLNVHGAICDEIHAWTSRKLWDTLETSTGSRRQPLLFEITTAGWDRNSFCWTQHAHAISVLEGNLHDDSVFAYVASLDEGDDPFDEAVWIKSNPNLHVSVKIENLREQAEKAKQIPSQLNAFLRFRMNVWTESHSRWIDLDIWDEGGAPIDIAELEGRECIGGLDLATTMDLTAFVLLFSDDDGGFTVLPSFWIPGDNVEKRVTRDHVPYDVWIRRGLVKETDGNVCDYDVVREDIKDLCERFRVKEIAFDRWNSSQLVTQLQSDGATMVPVGLGFASMAAPTKECEKLVLGRKLRHGGNPLLRWNVGNVAIKIDPAGNQKPDKSKSAEKIDGLVALLLALSRAIVQESTGSIYDVTPNSEPEPVWILPDE